jgi:hypothetical protein
MNGKRACGSIAILFVTLSIANPSSGSEVNRLKAKKAVEEARIARCIRASAAGRSWLEKTLWGLRDQEAGWVGAEVANRDGSHDLGPMQINSWWVGKIAAITRARPELVRWWLANDACFNVNAARWIFLSGLAATGEYWKAVGTYHSPTAWRQQRYAAAVSNHLRRRYGRDIFGSGTPKAAPRR